MTILLLIAGIITLIVGAELLVQGASRIAAAARISPLMIGLTVVAYGTSSPELAVSVISSLSGQANIAVGNVVGSNIFNMLFILGLSALISPLIVSQQLVRLDVPIMIIVSILILALGVDSSYSRAEGLMLFLIAIGYTVLLVFLGKRDKNKMPATANARGENGKSTGKWYINIGVVIAGLALLTLGSQWLVSSAILIAKYFGISEFIIGLTIVAAGTSLPEVATSVIASIRGERDIAVGNVVGSNIFNILAVLGLSAIAAPSGIHVTEGAIRFDIPVMLAVAIACLPIFFTGHRIARWEGGLFLSYYFAYILYLFLSAREHDLLPLYSTAMLGFVIPITIITLLLLTFRAIRNRR